MGEVDGIPIEGRVDTSPAPCSTLRRTGWCTSPASRAPAIGRSGGFQLDPELMPGTGVTAELTNASGDPVAHRIPGNLIALRPARRADLDQPGAPQQAM